MQKDKQKLILLIDDSADIQELLKTVFESKGYRVKCTSNGKEALSLLQESVEMPDLILLDTQMPVMDGFRFRYLQSEDERYSKIPTVVVTADDEGDLGGRMQNPDAILKKPFELHSMLTCILPFIGSPDHHEHLNPLKSSLEGRIN